MTGFMKSIPSFFVGAGLLITGNWAGFAQSPPPIPDASISVSVSPGTVEVGQTFTVTCRVTSYQAAQEVDEFAFVVNYNLKALSAVQGSFNLGSSSGSDPQFLSKANQEAVTNGFAITNLCDASRPGRAYVTVADTEVDYPPERGSIASSGFLVSFQMTALAPGSWQLAAAPYLQEGVFFNTFHQPVGATVNFSSPTIVVRNPTSIMVQAVDANASESGEDTGLFLFTRTGPTNEQAVARFNISGSAAMWDDYELIPTWIVIPAGASNISLTITPVDDSAIEGDETVMVTLWTPGDYEISGSGTATVTIHDDENMPPSVTLTAPAHGTIYANPTNITLAATASDSNGSVTNVEFFREGTIKLGEDASSPYSFTWSNAPAGTYVLTAKATDNLGATAVSVPKSITVRGSPSVVITSPTNGATFGASGSITISATATDPDGPLAFIELYRNGTVFAATNGGVITALWTNMPPGTNTFYARTCDDRGLLSTSSTVVVTVSAFGMSDAFSLRPFTGGYSLSASANNTAYTRETGEPLHGGESGDHSAWLAWTAPITGTAWIDTFSSTFDTVLAVYTNGPGAPGLNNLALVAANNDAGGEQSEVELYAEAGQTYAVAVDGFYSENSGTIQLNIFAQNLAPTVWTQPQSVLASVGDNVSFSVAALGPTPRWYQWRRNGVNVSAANAGGVTTSSLTLTNVALTNAGLYDVVVSNYGGSVTSAPAVLVVRAPAEFTQLPAQQVVNPGGTATFTVGASGSDPLNYQWSFNGVLLPGEITNSFTRYNAQYADGGTYSVSIANAAGNSSAGAELIVRPLFTSWIPTNGNLLLHWHGTTGKVYLVEGTTNVASTNWTVLGSVTNTALEGQFSVSLTNPPARALRLRVGQ